MTPLPEFGIRRENEERRDGGCAVVFDPETQRYAVGKRSVDGLLLLFSGGVDENEDVQEGTLREVTEESGLHNFKYVEKIGEVMTHYRNINKNVNRIAKATCFLVILKDRDLLPTKLEVHEKFHLAWVTAQEMLEHWAGNNQDENYSHWIYFLEKAVERAVALGYDKTSAATADLRQYI